MENFNDLQVGGWLWFSKEGNIGQYRIKNIDKENNKITYNNGVKDITIPFDYNKNKNNEFFADLQDATNDAIHFAKINFNIQNPGTPNAHVTWKSPEKIEQAKRKEMLFS